MHHWRFFAMALFAVCLASCGGGAVTPVSKKINGPLGKFFKVAQREYKMSDNELCVEFIKVAEGGPTTASWASSTPVFTVELQDEDGNVISSKSTNAVFLENQLGTVLSLGVGESSSIAFKFDKSEGTAKFKVSSKWNIMEESPRTLKSGQSGDNPYQWLSERLATADDLAGKSQSELRIMRNTIYAMHGYIFKTADMKEHFGNLSWYQARKNDVSSELSSIERKNVMLIQRYE